MWQPVLRTPEAELIIEAQIHCRVTSVDKSDSWIALPQVLSQHRLIKLESSYRQALNDKYLNEPDWEKSGSLSKRASDDRARRARTLQDEYEDLALRAVVTTPLCDPLYKVEDPRIFLQAFISLLDGQLLFTF